MDTKPLTRRFLAGWADMDWNSHMANTAYLNKVVDARLLALAEKGLSAEDFLRLRIGVVVMKPVPSPHRRFRGTPLQH